jgi:anti-sigma regulatory factor (Ser/Thr protein kinase)
MLQCHQTEYPIMTTPGSGPAQDRVLAAQRSYTAAVPADGPGGWPLGNPPDNADVLQYGPDLARARSFAAERGRRAGLPPQRVTDLMIVVGELTANTFAHTTGPGTLTMWVTDRDLICQVQDEGELPDPQAGLTRPDPSASGGGRGLWVVRQLCDLVEIRTGRSGTTIRAHLRLRQSGGPAG